MMAIDDQNLPELVKEVRRQLSLSQEDLARELGISFATVNRWENGLVKPSKLAKAQLDNFCAKMTRQGKLKLTGLPVRPPVRNARAGGRTQTGGSP
jgi:transcriptional regulator with XRE-family HTH domain